MDLAAILILLTGLFIAWNLGANDAANAMGTAVGSGVRTLKEAVALVSIFGFLGAVTLGQEVVKTVGRGIVPLDQIAPSVSIQIALAGMLAGGLWIMLATHVGMPVSTTHSTVGAVAGAGVAAGTDVAWDRLLDIVIAWVVTPFGGALVSFVLYVGLRRLFARVGLGSDRLMAWLVTLSGIYMSFSWGSNDVANATGLVLGANLMNPLAASAFGGVGIAVGIGTLGYKVIQTIGFRITNLAPLMAFSAEVSSALVVMIFSRLGIPVSTTHASVGSVYGVGLANGLKAVDFRAGRDIVLAWIATPLIAGGLAFVLFMGISSLGIGT